jgi:hypothetical protein
MQKSEKVRQETQAFQGIFSDWEAATKERGEKKESRLPESNRRPSHYE